MLGKCIIFLQAALEQWVYKVAKEYLLREEERNRYLKVPLADLVPKGKHTKENTSTTESDGHEKEYTFRKAWSIGIEGALTLVIAHQNNTQEIDTKKQDSDKFDCNHKSIIAG